MEKKRSVDPRLIPFGRRVAEARKAAGMTQAQLTNALIERGVHMPATAIAKIETATRPTTVVEALEIAIALEVSLGQLVTGGEGLIKDTYRPVFRAAVARATTAHQAFEVAAKRYAIEREEAERVAELYRLELDEQMNAGVVGEFEAERRRVDRALKDLPEVGAAT